MGPPWRPDAEGDFFFWRAGKKLAPEAGMGYKRENERHESLHGMLKDSAPHGISGSVGAL
jgi:hypothetical protein